MKQSVINILKFSPRRISLLLGVFFSLLYFLFIFYSPYEGWCDEVMFVDAAKHLLECGNFDSTIWGGGKFHYFPLYVYLLSLWIRIFGFGYIQVHILNIILVTITYIWLSQKLIAENILCHKLSVVLFSVLFWLSPTSFWIYNNGRVECLSLLLAIGTILFYIKTQRDNSAKNCCLLFLFSFLLASSSVCGIIGTTIFIFLLTISKWNQKQNVFFGCIIVVIGYVVSFCLTMLTMAYFHTLKVFIRSFIHSSSTIHYDTSISNMFIKVLAQLNEGLGCNHELLWGYIVLLVLFIVFYYIKRSFKDIQNIIIVCFFSSLFSPLIFSIAGRFSNYYTYIAYIPMIIVVSYIVDMYSNKMLRDIIASGLCLLMVVYFCFSGNGKEYKHIDLQHSVDVVNERDVERWCLNDRVVIYPCKWYYYIMSKQPHNSCVCVVTSYFPRDANYLIIDENSYYESILFDLYDITLIDQSNDLTIYKINGWKGW